MPSKIFSDLTITDKNKNMAKAVGISGSYKGTIQQWIGTLPDDEAFWNSEDGDMTGKKVAAIVVRRLPADSEIGYVLKRESGSFDTRTETVDTVKEVDCYPKFDGHMITRIAFGAIPYVNAGTTSPRLQSNGSLASTPPSDAVLWNWWNEQEEPETLIRSALNWQSALDFRPYDHKSYDVDYLAMTLSERAQFDKNRVTREEQFRKIHGSANIYDFLVRTKVDAVRRKIRFKLKPGLMCTYMLDGFTAPVQSEIANATPVIITKASDGPDLFGNAGFVRLFGGDYFALNFSDGKMPTLPNVTGSFFAIEDPDDVNPTIEWHVLVKD